MIRIAFEVIVLKMLYIMQLDNPGYNPSALKAIKIMKVVPDIVNFIQFL